MNPLRVSDPLATTLTQAIRTGNLRGLKRLLDERPDLATFGLEDAHARPRRRRLDFRPHLTGNGLMPFKSQAQRRKFAELLVEGKISNQTFEEWNRETGGRKLPERVKRKRKASRKTARKRR